MGTNCLVTKLKAVVNNDNLEKFGEWVFDVDFPSEGTLLAVKYGSKAITLDMLYTEGNLNVISIDANGYVKVSGNGKLHIKDKYNISYLTLYASRFDFSDLTYFPLKVLSIPKNRTIVDNLSLLNQINIFKDLEILEIIGSWPHNISGDVADLNIFLQTINFEENRNITGTIESYVAHRRSLGDTVGSMTFKTADTNITFNGQRNTDFGTGDLSWTADTITFKGETINA